MKIDLIHPYWHSVVTSEQEPILAALKDGNYYEVAGKRHWPEKSVTVVADGKVRLSPVRIKVCNKGEACVGRKPCKCTRPCKCKRPCKGC